MSEADQIRDALERIANDQEFSHRNGKFVRKVWYVEEAKRALAHIKAQPVSNASHAIHGSSVAGAA